MKALLAPLVALALLGTPVRADALSSRDAENYVASETQDLLTKYADPEGPASLPPLLAGRAAVGFVAGLLERDVIKGATVHVDPETGVVHVTLRFLDGRVLAVTATGWLAVLET